MLFVSGEPDNKPQTLLFSATVPQWVQRTARKYLRSDIVKLDLVGRGTVRTATSVEVVYTIRDLLHVYIFVTILVQLFDILDSLHIKDTRIGMIVFMGSLHMVSIKK